ncbi:MAG TPA: SCO family protein [Pyrinomonadaceae bacterium]|jgi:cytochrome oxidase Cu insertion factor (SCO1/SenC/PrrC family)
MRSRHLYTAAAFALALVLSAAAPAPRARAAADDPHGAAEEVVYSCPMHPEVKSKKKGRCPKCKMDLRPEQAAAATTPDAGTKAAAAEAGVASSGASKMSIPDVELFDQDGRKVRFYTDLVKGRVVAVNFIFTTCTTICPPLGATFARVQKELAGRDVRLISISVDPATDTPERLKAWGAKFHAAEGWTFVTGRKPQVDELLRALGAATGSPADHTPTVLIGNDAAGQWTRTYGLARPSVLVGLIDAAAAGRLDNKDESTPKE